MSTQISPEDVFGRTKLITSIWKWLKKKSIIFTAERRIGKTTVMKVLKAQPEDGYVVIYIDVESIDSVSRFVELLLTKIEPHLKKHEKALGLFNTLINRISGAKIAGLFTIPEGQKKHWESIIEDLFKCICHENEEFKLLLMLDELPYMLQKIKEKSDNDSILALTILDIFRKLRSEYPSSLRMIFTGSIGLHHVLQELRGNKFASEPFNEMEKIEISTLDTVDALNLADKLLSKEKVNTAEENEDVKKLICQLTGNFPFYIEKIISRLSIDYDQVSCDEVNQVVLTHLTDDHDHWEMEHFRSRLNIYYPENLNGTQGELISKAKIARLVLDILALSDKPTSINEVWQQIKLKLHLDDKNEIIQILSSLAKDNYLMSDTQKNYQFRFDLIKRWWLLAQGLQQEQNHG